MHYAGKVINNNLLSRPDHVNLYAFDGILIYRVSICKEGTTTSTETYVTLWHSFIDELFL